MRKKYWKQRRRSTALSRDNLAECGTRVSGQQSIVSPKPSATLPQNEAYKANEPDIIRYGRRAWVEQNRFEQSIAAWKSKQSRSYAILHAGKDSVKLPPRNSELRLLDQRIPRRSMIKLVSNS